MSNQAMIDVFKNHVEAELAGDLDTTTETINEDPHLHNVPTIIGGVDYDLVCKCYRDYLVGKFCPPHIKMTDVSITSDDHQSVDELVIKFTHT